MTLLQFLNGKIKINLSGSIASTMTLLKNGSRKPSVYDLEPKERVVLHIVTLWAGVAVAAAKVKAAAS